MTGVLGIERNFAVYTLICRQQALGQHTKVSDPHKCGQFTQRLAMRIMHER